MDNKNNTAIKSEILIKRTESLNGHFIEFYKRFFHNEPELKQQNRIMIGLLNKYKIFLIDIDLDFYIKFSVFKDTRHTFGVFETPREIPKDKKFLMSFSLNEALIYPLNKYVIIKGIAMYKKWIVNVDEKNLVKYTMNHEFGHLLEELIILRRFLHSENNNKYSVFRIIEANNIRNRIISLCKKNSICFEKNLSDNSKANHFEWFAELFTSYNLSSGKLKPIAFAFKEFLEEEKNIIKNKSSSNLNTRSNIRELLTFNLSKQLDK